jgi:site-specific DNA recombinase
MALQLVPVEAVKAVGYIRVSKAREKMISPELQVAAIQVWADRMNRVILTWVEDLDVTGRNFDRKIMDAIALVEQREVSEIIVWKYSRFGRNRRGWAVNLGRVEDAGGQLQSATEDIDATSSGGKFQRGIYAEIAAWESDRIGESWKETHAYRLEKGLPHSPSKRLGYLYENKKYVPDQVEAPALRKVYLNIIQGLSLRSQASSLNSLGLTTARGGKFNSGNIQYSLDSGFAAGMIVRWLKRHTPDYHQGEHEPIISKQEWQAYQDVRSLAVKQPPRHNAPTHRLSGLLVCACGQKMIASKANGKPTFICGSRNQLTFENHSHVAITESRAEAEVLAWLTQQIRGHRQVGNDIEPVFRKEQATRDLVDASEEALVTRELAKVVAQRNRLAMAFAEGVMDSAPYKAVDADLSVRETQVTQRLAELRVRAQRPPQAFNTVLEAFKEASVEVARLALRSVLDTINVLPAESTRSISLRLSFRWKQ